MKNNVTTEFLLLKRHIGKKIKITILSLSIEENPCIITTIKEETLLEVFPYDEIRISLLHSLSDTHSFFDVSSSIADIIDAEGNILYEFPQCRKMFEEIISLGEKCNRGSLVASYMKEKFGKTGT